MASLAAYSVVIFIHRYGDSDSMNVKNFCITSCLLIHLNINIQHRHQSSRFIFFKLSLHNVKQLSIIYFSSFLYITVLIERFHTNIESCLKNAITAIMPRSHRRVKLSRKSRARKFSRNGVTWLPRGSYGVFVVITGSMWLLRVYLLLTWRLPGICVRVQVVKSESESEYLPLSLSPSPSPSHHLRVRVRVHESKSRI